LRLEDAVAVVVEEDFLEAEVREVVSLEVVVREVVLGVAQGAAQGEVTGGR